MNLFGYHFFLTLFWLLSNIYYDVTNLVSFIKKLQNVALSAKVFFLWFVFYKKILLHMVKNILWKSNLYIFNIYLSKVVSKIEIIVKLMVEIKHWCLLSYN